MNNLKIRWIGQSGYILSDDDTIIYIDPYLSDCVNRVAGRERMVPAPVSARDIKADAFICTHNHLDHVDVDLIEEMNTDGIDFYAPTDCKETLENLGVKGYNAFDMGSTVKIGNFEVEAVYADHTVPAIGVVVKHSGNTLYFTSDTLYNEKLAKVKCDILFICINGKLGNMNVDEAIKITKMISPKTAVPNHYDMFESNSEDPRKFKVENSFVMEHNKEYEVKYGCLI